MTQPGKSIHLLLADDHAMVRQSLRLALQLEPDLEIVGEARDGREAVALARLLKPDLLLLDLNLPDLDGLDVVRQVQCQVSPPQILILSGIQAQARVSAAVEVGVAGYIVKEARITELVAAIHYIAAGEPYFHPSITQALIHRQAQANGNPSPAIVQTNLSDRELAVLQQMRSSATNREIATQLHISEETVRSHVKNILRKLNQSNRTQAVVEGVRQGLISLD